MTKVMETEPLIPIKFNYYLKDIFVPFPLFSFSPKRRATFIFRNNIIVASYEDVGKQNTYRWLLGCLNCVVRINDGIAE
jgi:hypothetical protein